MYIGSNLTAAVAVTGLIFAYAVPSGAGTPNSLTSEEKQQGFEVLFNGRDLTGWKHAGNWKVENGEITREGSGGSLEYASRPVPDDFELRFEWKVAPGSNSGVYYRPTQYEYQILDNALHNDGKNPRTSAASLYFCMAPSHDATRPIGEWNQARIMCGRTLVQHWLNGEKVIHLNYNDPKWSWHVALLANRGGDLTARGAHLTLQDHGDPVWYRGLKLRSLRPDEILDMSSVTPAVIPDAVLAAEQRQLQRIMEHRARLERESGP